MVDYVKLQDEQEKPQKRRIVVRRRRINYKTIILLFIVLFLISTIISSITFALSSKIAVVPIKGVISTEQTSSIYGDTISSRNIANTLYEIQQDDSIKAVLLDINSPGGSPVASEEISRAIEELKKVKPVYSVINDMGASGAFWVAVSTDKIYASSMSVVGSVGVTATSFGFEDFIEEYDIHYRRQTAGEFKDMGTPYREQTDEEEEKMQELLDSIHTSFINHVAVSRNMTFDEALSYSTGEIFLGSKAQEIGFIDEIGYYPDVIAELENIVDNHNLLIVNYGPEPTLIDVLGVNSFFDAPSTQSQILLK